MYEVGQILYTIIENRQKVYPVKVVEQVIKKTLDGEFIEYTVKIPGTKTFKKINYNIYKSVANQINKIISNFKNDLLL